MPVVCVGPVCIPIWHLGAALLVLLKPLWRWLQGNCCKRRREEELIGKETEIKGDQLLNVEHKGRTDSKDNYGTSTSLVKDKQGGQTRRKKMEDGNLEPTEVEQHQEQPTVIHSFESSLDFLRFLRGLLSDGDSSSPSPFLVVFVKFTADWCLPCRKINPYYHELARKYGGVGKKEGDVVFTTVDVECCEEVASYAGASILPAFLVLTAENIKANHFLPDDQIQKVENEMTKWKLGEKLIGPSSLKELEDFICRSIAYLRRYAWR